MTDNEESGKEGKEIDQEYDFATAEKQVARAFLRERFLRVVTGVVGKQAQFHMHENTKVSAEFRGCDTDCLEVFARNLTTPLGKIPEAILRTSDIIYFEMEGLPLPESTQITS
ncbi:gem-associated protein 7-like [Belonocnema kinseyi]|uniref:gem-associated protein 7-like n=1 Tax=Belonocnema kinseyi TaxID=2817044 RepID=UPI00143D7844|nr:gem-associated protein 7-like [Belonocnema kinseyi]